MENTNVVTGHGICHMRRVSLIQALRLKVKGIEMGRGVKPIQVAKTDYPELKGRTAAAILAGVEAMDVVRCYCDEGRKVATEAGIPATDPVYMERKK